LMHHLETVHIAGDRNLTDFRFPVQLVTRPNLNFRGYAGTVSSGIVKSGDEVMVLPSRKTNRVKSIVTWEGEIAEAFAGMAITLTLEKEVDNSRGDLLVHPHNLPEVDTGIEAMLVWMAEQPMIPGKQYYVKLATKLVNASVREVRHRVNVNTLAHESARQMGLNEIAQVTVDLEQTAAFDPYKKNRSTGAFGVIDRLTHGTVGAGMILNRAEGGTGALTLRSALDVLEASIRRGKDPDELLSHLGDVRKILGQ
jgi:bifunctional enzyme CysN/CysC